MIHIELTPELYSNLRALVVAGAKSPQTGEEFIYAAAQLLQIMSAAAHKAQDAARINSHEADTSIQPER